MRLLNEWNKYLFVFFCLITLLLMRFVVPDELLPVDPIRSKTLFFVDEFDINIEIFISKLNLHRNNFFFSNKKNWFSTKNCYFSIYAFLIKAKQFYFNGQFICTNKISWYVSPHLHVRQVIHLLCFLILQCVVRSFEWMIDNIVLPNNLTSYQSHDTVFFSQILSNIRCLFLFLDEWFVWSTKWASSLQCSTSHSSNATISNKNETKKTTTTDTTWISASISRSRWYCATRW